MDIGTVNAIISGCAALFGVLTGGTVTYISSARQQKREISRQKTAARHAREELAAQRCEQLLAQMADELEHTQPPSLAKYAEKEIAREDRARQAHKQFEAEALYLSEKIRERMTQLGEILAEVENLSFYTGNYGGTHYHSPHTICRIVRREAQTVIATFVKDQVIPPPAQSIKEYRKALADLRSEQAEYYALAEQHDDYLKAFDRRKGEFYERHPELRPDTRGD